MSMSSRPLIPSPPQDPFQRLTFGARAGIKKLVGRLGVSNESDDPYRSRHSASDCRLGGARNCCSQRPTVCRVLCDERPTQGLREPATDELGSVPQVLGASLWRSLDTLRILQPGDGERHRVLPYLLPTWLRFKHKPSNRVRVGLRRDHSSGRHSDAVGRERTESRQMEGHLRPSR